MRLAHLDQRILLHWGDAALLANAVEHVLCEQLELAQPARPTWEMALAMGPLYRVRARLLGRAGVERHFQGPRPRTPWKLTLRYDELVALMFILPEAPAAGQAWGAVQQASFLLERYVNFS
ncbi:MAG: hypothetical protein ACRYF0_02720 [Janthinobacterium lividum]